MTIPIYDPRLIELNYKALDFFADKNSRKEVQASLVFLRALTFRNIGTDMLICPALRLEFDNSEFCEVDFVALVRESLVDGHRFALTFVECKAPGRRFDKKAFHRFESLIARFPLATYIYASAQPKFEAKERERLRSLASQLNSSTGTVTHRMIVLGLDELSVDDNEIPRELPKSFDELSDRTSRYWVKNGKHSDIDATPAEISAVNSS